MLQRLSLNIVLSHSGSIIMGFFLISGVIRDCSRPRRPSSIQKRTWCAEIREGHLGECVM